MNDQPETTTTPEGQRAPGVFLSEGAPAMAELSEALAKLAAITPRLNAATDGANTVFRATEELLGKIGIGIDASVFVDVLKSKGADQGPVVDEVLILVYERIGGKYRVGFDVHTSTWVGDPESPTTISDEFAGATAWDQSPREWKLKGVSELAQLIAQIAEEADKLTTGAESATTAVQALLHDLTEAAKLHDGAQEPKRQH